MATWHSNKRRIPGAGGAPATPRRAWLAWLACLALFAFGCNMIRIPPPATSLPATLPSVPSTQTALPLPADATASPAAPSTPAAPPPPAPTAAAPGAGSISGRLTYPSGSIPPLRVVAFPITGDGQPFFADTAQGQVGYVLQNLPAGAYFVVAYTLDGKMAGGYSKAVTCGLAVSCADHGLIPVPVVAGQDASGINPGDWYAPLAAFPPWPWGEKAGPAPPAPDFGSLSGRLSYPSSGIPPLRVVAFSSNGQQAYVIETVLNQSIYQIPSLLPGIYHVVAYTLDGKLAGGYSRAVPCGLSAACTDHSLIDVAVAGGQDTPGVDPGDWYAPPGAFPAAP